MTAMIDSPVIRELAAILQNVDPFPEEDSDLTTCRGFKKDSKRCMMTACSSQKKGELKALFSQFQIMTTCADTNGLYDNMQTFIDLTHCWRHHRNACQVFDKWKAQRKATISSPRPVTPSRSATVYHDSFESISDLSNMEFHSLYSDTSADELGLDSSMAEKIKGLKIGTPVQHNRTQTDDCSFNKVDTQKQRYKKRLGTIRFPEEGETHNKIKIEKKIGKNIDAKMDAGIVYIFEHTELPDLFKIGFSRSTAKDRHNQNCFKSETDIIHGKESKAFIGAKQAEGIAHAILSHKKLIIENCLHCKDGHDEWFLASKEEVVSAVEVAERWLKMPAYALRDGVYELTPSGERVYQLMFPFAINKLNVLIDIATGSGNTSGAFPNNTPAAATRESSASSPLPSIFVQKSPDTTPSRRRKPRGKSPVGGGGGKTEESLLEIEEIFHRRRRSISNDGVEVREELKIVRKISKTELKDDSGIYDKAKPVVFDVKGKKQSAEIKVQELKTEDLD